MDEAENRLREGIRKRETKERRMKEENDLKEIEKGQELLRVEGRCSGNGREDDKRKGREKGKIQEGKCEEGNWKVQK